jgi:O-antigen/teichoic acid export membrane protein
MVAAGLSFWVVHWFDIPAGDVADAKKALVIVGGQLAIAFLFKAFDGALAGYERFDLLNSVDIVAALARAGGAVAVVNANYGFVGLAWTTLGVTTCAGLVKLVLCSRVVPDFRISPAYVRKAALREVGTFGLWTFLVFCFTRARLQLTPILVGAVLGPAMLTGYAIASRVLTYGCMLFTESTNVLASAMTTLVGEGDHARQQRLVLKAGTIHSAFSLYVVAGICLLSRSFITLWVGPRHTWAAGVATALALGEWLPMSVYAVHVAVYARGLQRPIAWRGAAECACCLLSAAVLGPRFGLTGMAMGFAVAATYFRGVFLLRFGARTIDLPIRTYLRNTVVPVLLHGAGPVGALWVAVSWKQPARWLEFLAYCLGFTALYGLALSRVLRDVWAFRAQRPLRGSEALTTAT